MLIVTCLLNSVANVEGDPAAASCCYIATHLIRMVLIATKWYYLLLIAVNIVILSSSCLLGINCLKFVLYHQQTPYLYVCDRLRKTGYNAACVNIEKRSIDFLKMYCFKPTEGNS